MKFGPVPVTEAAGAILAHAVPLKKGRLRKGQVLSADDVMALQAAGLEKVIVARLDPGDLNENDAAAALANALAGAGLRVTRAATGRVNIHATGPGIVTVDADAIAAFNAVNPMITVATVPRYHQTDADGMVATVKIIAYAVPEADVAKAAALGRGALSLLSPVYKTATLIETEVGETPADKGRRALAGRLDRFGMTLSDRVIVSHDASAIAGAVKAAADDIACDAIFVLTASATSDVADVGPQGLRDAGGRLIHFGMPVDPGNLLFLGDISGKPVIGLPGCARSPALNGADWVMGRVLCGLTLGPADFAAMGVGGLLKEIPTRPQPRADI